MSIYMQVDNIKGSSTDANHNGWIELKRFNQSTKRRIFNQVGTSQDRESSIPYVGEIEIIKSTDKSSPYLFQKMLEGTAIPNIKIEVCHTSNGMRVNRQYLLKNVLISYFEDDAKADEHSIGTEYLKLNFTQIEARHTPYQSDGQAESPLTVGYDLSQAKVT